MDELQIEDQSFLRMLEYIRSHIHNLAGILETNRFNRFNLVMVEVNWSFCYLNGFRSAEAVGQSFIQLLRLDSDSSYTQPFNFNILKQNP